jgi:hypothetical protein
MICSGVLCRSVVTSAMSWPVDVVVLRSRMTRTTSVRQVPYHRPRCSAICTVLVVP